MGWLRNDIMGMMLDSEIHNDIAQDILGENYLRINSSIGRINRMLDDDSDENLEKFISWDLIGGLIMEKVQLIL